MVLLLCFFIIAFVGDAQNPPSDLTTNCRYVSFTSVNSGEYDIVPIDSCFETRKLEIISNTFTQSAYRWRCEFDSSTNITSPVLYVSNSMNECNNNDDTSDGGIFTVDSYNCDSDIICPWASFYRSAIDTEYFDCARYNNITLNQTLVDQYQDSDSNIEAYIYAMNVCDNNGSVYTCDGNTIYQWMYNDAHCTDYNDYEIYVANSLDCQLTLLSYPTKNIVDQCVMTSSPSMAPTASPPTYDPPTNDPTAAPSTNGTTSSTTKYTRPLTTAASKSANLLSTMVNLVALLIVCICVIIQ